MRTPQNVRDFLNGAVGIVPVDRSNGALNGQCVALVKTLYDFLGVPNAYAGRGNARDALTTAERQGVATASDGWLRVCVNRNFSRGYGHIWIDLRDEANFESNGARALHVTKNTRPIGQAQQIGNLDKWLDFGAPAQPQMRTWTVKGTCYVRTAPTTSAPSVRQPTANGLLNPGNTFSGFSATVAGQSVGGNNQWAKSARGNYVWTGNLR